MPKKIEVSFYQRIITDAWRVAWQHKHLWVFGFFATSVGFGGVTEALFSSSDKVYAFFPAIASGKTGLQMIPGIAAMQTIVKFTSFPILSILLFLVMMGLFVGVFLWMGNVAAGALVSSVKKIEKGAEPTFSEGLKAGSEKFWRVLGANILTQPIIFVGSLLTTTTLNVLILDHTVASGIFYVGTFILFVLLAVSASVAAVYSTCFVVNKNQPLVPALFAGWKLLHDHWLVTLEMAFFLFLSSLGIGLSAVLASLIISVPFIFLLLIVSMMHLSAASTLVLMVASGLMLAMIVCVGSFITVFQVSAWTLLWGEMTERQPLSKLRRLARHISPHLG